MNYKNIVLGILLIPSATFAQSNLEKLEQQRYEKVLEVRKIIQEINNAYSSIMNMLKVYRSDFYSNLKERLNEMENPISEEDMHKIMLNENKNIYHHVKKAINGEHPLDISVIDSVFRNESPDSFCSDKFIEASAFIEYSFIKDTVQRYKKALAELVIITHQIYALQKEDVHA